MKRLLCILLTFIMVFILYSTMCGEEFIQAGDVNFDGDISLTDVITSAKYVLQDKVPSVRHMKAADLNSSGCIELADVLLLSKVVIGNIDVEQIDVQILNTTTRLDLHEQPKYTMNKCLQLKLAKRESESAQFSIYSAYRNYHNLKVKISELVNEFGNKISSDQVDLYREYFVVQDYEWTVGKIDASDQEKTASILIPMKYDDYNNITTQVKENTVYQLDIHTDADTPAGTYTGTITMNHDNGQIDLLIEVTVWDFELPETPTFRTLFGYWPWHTEYYTRFTGEKLDATIREGFDLAKKYKISLSSLPDAVIGKSSDAETYAKSVADYIKINPNQTAFIIPFYYSVDAEGRWYITDSNKEQNLNLYSALEKYGILDRGYIYANDEPHTDLQRYNMNVVGNFLKENGLNDKVHNIVPITNLSELTDSTNTWCPLTGKFDIDIINRVRESTGADFWWYYIGDGPQTGINVRKDLSYTRMQGWFARQYDIKGGLHWLTNMYGYYIENSEKQGYFFDDVNVYGIGDAAMLIQGLEGDGVLNRDIVVPTLYLTAFRDSIEDYDYLVLLEQRIKEFILQTGIDITVEEAMQSYYNGLSVSFDEFATSESPENISVMRKHIAQTILNGADYLLTQKTLSNGYRYNQKEFIVYVKSGSSVEMSGDAELLHFVQNPEYDVYTFLYTHQDMCEFLTLKIGENTYIRPIQMSLTIHGEPQTFIDLSNKRVQDLLIEANPYADIVVQTEDGNDKLLFSFSGNDDYLYIPSELICADVAENTDVCGIFDVEGAEVSLKLDLETRRDYLTIIDTKLESNFSGELTGKIPEVPSLDSGITGICLYLDSQGKSGVLKISELALINKPVYQGAH